MIFVPDMQFAEAIGSLGTDSVFFQPGQLPDPFIRKTRDKHKRWLNYIYTIGFNVKL